MAADAAGATHAGWLQMRGGALRRWQNRYFALFPPGSALGSDAPALRFKALPGDAAWAGVLPLDGVSAGALPLGDGHATAACFYIHRQGKTYVLAASSEAEVQRWLTCIADELRSALAVAARRSAESPRPPHAALPWLGESCDGGASMSEAALTDDDAGSELGCASPSAAAAAAGAEVRALNGVWRGVLAAREAVLQEALRTAEGERARAERAAMRAEEDRAALLAAAREQRAAATRWRGAARRALVRCAVMDAARTTAEAQLAAERAAREAEANAAREAAEAAEAAQRAAMAEEAEQADLAERRAAADAENAKAAAEAAARRLAALLFADAATAHWWRGPQCSDGDSGSIDAA